MYLNCLVNNFPNIFTFVLKIQSLNTVASINTWLMKGKGMAAKTLIGFTLFWSPLMKRFHLAGRQLCAWPLAVTCSHILSNVWGSEPRTPLQGKLIFTEDAVLCCTNLHEIWLPFINQDKYAPVHQRCLPSEFVVFQACWLEANSINHITTHDFT